MAQRFCGRGVCDSPAARGVGGLDRGAEGCAQRVVFHADAGSLCRLCPPPAVPGPLLDGGVDAGAGADVQADGGHAPVCAVLVGLLAAETIHPTGRPFGSLASDRRKGSAAGSFRRSLRGHAFCAEGGDRVVASLCANRQRPGFLRCLFGTDDLSGWIGRSLSSSGKRPGALENYRGLCPVAGHLRRGHCRPAEAPLVFVRLVVVFGDVGSGNRVDSVGVAGAGGSLHVSAADWLVSVADLGGGGSVRRLASPPRGAGRLLHDHSGGFDFLRARADGLLAQQ